MCGLAGMVVFESVNHRVDASELTAMRDVMVHRGPDGCGLWVRDDGAVGLAHRRLSIIDLSDLAAQPMTNPGQTVRLVFNGEIYNHAALRLELKHAGRHHWVTDHSDTEVLLQAYEQWGIDCLHRLRGMFAIAIWDETARTLWLARDRIGVKPLYYSVRAGRLTFASEIKALLEVSGQPREVNEEALHHYLSFATTPAPMTLFAGIHKLSPGTVLRVTLDGTITPHRYWDVLDHAAPLGDLSDDDIAALVRERLRESVQLRKVGDVPMGVFLSGGIDSSTNAALFSEGSDMPVRTFSIGYKGNPASTPSELPHAREMARLVGAAHHERELDVDDLLTFLPRMVWLQDEPLGDPVCVPVHYVSKLARDAGVVVCQVGEGADELFWGYPSWKIKLGLERANQWPVPRFAKRLGLRALEWAGQSGGHPYEALRRGANGLPVFWGGADTFTFRQKQALLSPRLRAKHRHDPTGALLRPLRDHFLERAWEPSPLGWMTYLDLNLRLPELLLMRVDKMSMGVSLEARVPFLDHALVELAMSIPEAVKTRHGTLKHILKKAVRGIIPDAIIDRRKQGFGVPVAEWCVDRLGETMARDLDGFCQRTDYFSRETIETMLARRDATRLWLLLNFVRWHAQFIEQRDPVPVTQ
ncbi:MAG: asparagine synthase (glutamine-hydrolyzing) [Proteobacteria bacterium]|nr:asparagine synthase (glutamine-hydrolyzing) [Pseudomonadota bacterium]